MVSFIPILALFVLILSNACFSAPVDAEPNPNIGTQNLQTGTLDKSKNEEDTKSGFNKKPFGKVFNLL